MSERRRTRPRFPLKAISAFALASLMMASNAFSADDYPSKPIRLVVPFAPGGNTDIAGREIAKGIGDILGQQIVVDNRPGAGGSIGAAAVAKAPADGYTLLLASSALTITPAVIEKIPYQLSDFDPVGLSMVTSLVLIASTKSGLKSVGDLLDRARKEPGKLTFGSAGMGSGSHLAGELFNQTANVKTVHVAYKGSGPATVAIMAGEVDVSFTSQGGSVSAFESGRVTALAITGKTPSPLFPKVPPIGAAGVQGFEAGDWIGLLAPKGTPPQALAKLNRALATWMAQPGTLERLSKYGFEGRTGTPEQFRTLLNDELIKWGRTAKLASIKAE